MRVNELNKRRGKPKPLILRASTVVFDYDGDSTDENFIMLGYDSNYTFDFTVDWGDGNIENLTNSDVNSTWNGFIHDYQNSGTYDITITNNFPFIGNDVFDNLVNIIQWGDIEFSEVTFSGNTGLTEIIASDTPNFINISSFFGMFQDTSLESVKPNLFLTAYNATDFQRVFDTTNLAEIPEGLFKNCTSATTFDRAFLFTPITSIPNELFNNCEVVESFSSCFSGTDLASIPLGLFDNNNSVTDFSATFNDCISLTGNAPELWLRIPEPNGSLCFENCTGLTNYNDIPTDWK